MHGLVGHITSKWNFVIWFISSWDIMFFCLLQPWNDQHDFLHCIVTYVSFIILNCRITASHCFPCHEWWSQHFDCLGTASRCNGWQPFKQQWWWSSQHAHKTVMTSLFPCFSRCKPSKGIVDNAFVSFRPIITTFKLQVIQAPLVVSTTVVDCCHASVSFSAAFQTHLITSFSSNSNPSPLAVFRYFTESFPDAKHIKLAIKCWSWATDGIIWLWWYILSPFQSNRACEWTGSSACLQISQVLGWHS